MNSPLINSNAALAAYAQAAKRIGEGAGADQVGPASSFGDLLQQTLTDAVASGRRGEAASIQAASGKASLQDVVEAVTAAELSLQTVVSVRDRVISAYQEIMRMPI